MTVIFSWASPFDAYFYGYCFLTNFGASYACSAVLILHSLKGTLRYLHLFWLVEVLIWGWLEGIWFKPTQHQACTLFRYSLREVSRQVFCCFQFLFLLRSVRTVLHSWMKSQHINFSMVQTRRSWYRRCDSRFVDLLVLILREIPRQVISLWFCGFMLIRWRFLWIKSFYILSLWCFRMGCHLTSLF